MTTIDNLVNFDNTENAFVYKSDSALKQANLLFNAMGMPWLVGIGTQITPWAIKAGLPIKGIIRNTIFKQFVGGETLEKTADVAAMLAKYNVQVILDYGVEGGDEGEQGFNTATEQFLKVIKFAGSQPNIPFMSVKVTGIARFGLLEKLDASMHEATGTLIGRYEKALENLTEFEKREWDNVVSRLRRICEAARDSNVGVQVDAEESYIQDPVDAVVCLFMDEFNRNGKAVISNTAQLYRHDRLVFLQQMLEAAKSRGFVMGIKLVRGAYMAKERKRAAENGYPSPIQPDKAATDRDYNAAVQLCLDNLDHVNMVLASHNEESNLLAVQHMAETGQPQNHPHVHYSQLFGMSDHITFNLAKLGANVSKYLPFGPIEDVIPYLMRRAQENTSVSGQTSRELGLIKKEMERRGLS